MRQYLQEVHTVYAGDMGQVRTINTEVMVASAQTNLCQERIRICSLLWDAGIKVRSCYYKD